MNIIVIALIVVVIFLITQKVQGKEDFGWLDWTRDADNWFKDAGSTVLNGFDQGLQSAADIFNEGGSKYGKGLCSEVYQPNQNNYKGGTDCGKNNGVWGDWINNGGSCPDWQREAYDCGTGCRWAGGEKRCV